MLNNRVQMLRLRRGAHGLRALTLLWLGIFSLTLSSKARADNTVSQVSAGSGHACAIRSDGTLWCWGDNDRGQLGDGTHISGSTPRPVTYFNEGFVSVAQVSCGSEHTCAVRTDGTLWCWGDNTYGQLGNGMTSDSNAGGGLSQIRLPSNQPAVQVSAGYQHTCALDTYGHLYCWGSNGAGQLGDGTKTDRHTPVQVTVASDNFTQVSAGMSYTCAVGGPYVGNVFCWGWGSSGQLGLQEPYPSVNLKPFGSAPVADISAGNAHTCARTTDNQLWCWGENYSGELGDGTTVSRDTPAMVSFPTANNNDVAQVTTTGDGFTCARKTDTTPSIAGAAWPRSVLTSLVRH